MIRQIEVDNIRVICTIGKLHSFGGRPLMVDTGDVTLDAELEGHVSITTSYKERAVYRIGS